HLDPVGREQFHISPGFALSGEVEAFHAAVTNLQNGGAASPFARRYARSEEEIFGMELDAQTPREAESQIFQYNSRIYCEAGKPATKEKWRRIDGEWLKSSNSLALRLNNEVNNTSLVLAFELPTTKKVLLFTGDAQRGNWISWSDQSWETPEKKIVTAKDILSRCVFYKCGHHGSHNATLNGTADDDYPNLGWFARGEYSKDFVAMVPVHSSWARSKRGWQHPLPEIENALMKKARGRVVFNDRECVTRPNPNAKIGRLTDDEWLEFEQGKVETNVYKEITVWD
ncbi:ComEC/Rec2 family competence protein, partial [Ekhidna sp.]